MVSWVENVEEHSMQSALLPYVAMKIDPLIISFSGSKIVVRGKYDRKNSIISTQEKMINYLITSVRLVIFISFPIFLVSQEMKI